MSLRGIDISHWQNGIDINALDYDFMICKATEGVNYVDSACDGFVQKAKAAGKLWGFYHFMDKSDVIKQAEFFVANTKNYFGEGVPVLDYEMYGRQGTDKAKQFLDKVYELTGVRCMVYMSRSVTKEEDWSAIAPNHALWVAQYANDSTTGYQDAPWYPAGGQGAWGTVTVHQYSSHGRLAGYGGNLDLDIAYVTADGWRRLAAGDMGTSGDSGNATDDVDSPSGSVLSLAIAVMNGAYGNGDARKHALGSRYAEVQEFINHVASASNETLAAEVLTGKYGNGNDRKLILGGRYDAVQSIVNGTKSIDTIAREVIAGKWGNGNDRKQRLTAAGYDYATVQKKVNELC